MSQRRPISFIATDKPDEACQFYADVMGLSLVERSDFALVFVDGTHMLRVQIVTDLHPVGFTVHGWSTDNITTEMDDLRANGVEFLKYEGLLQDSSGVWQTPDEHKIAWFKDPSGNVLSLTQYRT